MRSAARGGGRRGRGRNAHRLIPSGIVVGDIATRQAPMLVARALVREGAGSGRLSFSENVGERRSTSVEQLDHRGKLSPAEFFLGGYFSLRRFPTKKIVKGDDQGIFVVGSVLVLGLTGLIGFGIVA